MRSDAWLWFALLLLALLTVSAHAYVLWRLLRLERQERALESEWDSVTRVSLTDQGTPIITRGGQLRQRIRSRL